MNLSKQILITGGRAPVAIDLGRNLARNDGSVHVADSLRFYMSQGSGAFSSIVVQKSNLEAVAL